MSDAARDLLLRYEIQHIFPSEILSSRTEEARNARRLLDFIEFNLELR